MSQKQVKRIRRETRRHVHFHWEQYWKGIDELTLRQRVRIAWAIVWKSKPPTKVLEAGARKRTSRKRLEAILAARGKARFKED